MRRRHFIIVTATSVGGLLVYTLDRRPFRVAAQDRDSRRSIRIKLRFFTQDEALDVAAAAARIFPSDETGPGAHEAGVVIYIDRQLAGPYGRDRYRYSQGPFVDGAPEQGYQGKLTPRDIYRQNLPHIAGLHRLEASEQDRRLREIESTLLFTLLRTHTIEGMFCDPMHGGNVDMIGWQLIGFPGPRMSYASEVDAYPGREFRPKPQSLSQILGRPIRPSEDEA
ncbi:MAG: gluconate 2-dehydrogenase subunit 3 family protein [Bryobacteraceae bacterium]